MLCRPVPDVNRKRHFDWKNDGFDSSTGLDSGRLGTSAFRAEVVTACTQDLADFNGDAKRLLIQKLYADIPGERIIARLAEEVTPASLAVAANGAMVARHLKRAHEVTIDLMGEARRVVRQAKLRGLLCTVTRTSLGVRLAVSGPLAVIRRTTYYGRALAELVPFLAWCPRFTMTARCIGQSGPYLLQVESGDPLPPAPSKPDFDSQVERRFARDFGKSTDAWGLVREPEPVVAPSSGGAARLVFPDFAAVRRTDPASRWLIEIVGFWTPGYLASKLDGLRSLGRERLLLCVDERLACDPDSVADFKSVVRYKGRVPVVDVLRVMET
jgi:predicted nuclease of restriction endonuclease-like RecB superfamily